MIRASQKYLVTLGLIALAIFTVSCDKNIARPEDLAQLTSVSIATLQVGDDELILGEGTTISWECTDDDGVVQSVEITELGQVPMSGDRGIAPEQSTLYTMNVYVSGEIVKSRSVYVKVLDEEGEEIIDASVSEVPSETACADLADDDGDGATDCDDSDCAGDAVCSDPTYEFTSVTNSAEGTNVVVGAEVSISWTSTFDKVLVYRDNVRQAKLYKPGDTFTFTAVDDATTIVLIGLVDGNEYDSSDAITIDALAETPDPVLDAEVTVAFTVSPATYLLYGQGYELSWDVNNATATLDGKAVSPKDTDDTYAAETTDGTITHTLTVTDNNGESVDYPVTITVASFTDAGVDALGAGINDLVFGPSANEYYFTANRAIYHTEDALATDADALGVSGITYDITALAESNGRIFAGCPAGLYVQESGATSYKAIISTPGNDITSLYAKSDGSVLVGTKNEIFSVNACESATKYCQSDQDSPAVSYGAYFYRFFADPAETSHLFAVSSDGLFESTDGGLLFNEVSSVTSVSDGAWTTGGAYVWGTSRVYELQDEGFDRDSTLEIGDINYIVGVNGYTFIATPDGVTAEYGGEIFGTNLSDPVDFLIVSGMDVLAVTTDGVIHKIASGVAVEGED